MLSSLAQQTKPELVHVDVACMANNGKPTTEAVVGLFNFDDKKRLPPIMISQWSRFRLFQKRGLVRNEQIKNCKTEWLLFSDCDMVYGPTFFEELEKNLKKHHSQAKYLISFGRTSNIKEEAEALVTSQITDHAVEIPNAFELANKLGKRYPAAGIDWGRPVNVGAGFGQIINMKYAQHEGYYVDPKKNRDWNWRKGNNPKSDINFRTRMHKTGGPMRKVSSWYGHNAIHLNHDRDPEFGKHITTQR